ncbi:site-specific integrase [Arcticibacter sp. MXS-1]|uniref:site-specific integrase n=1 Tax=Arcticibacter sp. MXS-1 TaxID=3341726 RepID=UPI0035A8F66F
MKTTSTFGVHFKVRTERTKDGKAPVFLGLVINGEKSYISLKNYQVDVKHWDKDKGSGKRTSTEGRRINEYLDEVRVKVRDCYQDLLSNGRTISMETFKDAFLGNGDPEYTLNKLMAYHNEQAKTVLEWSTLKHYYVTQRYLEKFLQGQFKKKDIFLHAINYKFVVDFECYLRNHKPIDHQKPMNNNGVMKHLIRLRKLTNLAIKLEWIKNDPFKNYKFKYQKIEKDFLTEKELQKLEKKSFMVDRLNMVKDLFVFCCYTGLAYVDVMNLTSDHIITGIDNGRWIKTFRQKTLTPVNTPLLPKAQAILQKYADDPRATANKRLFPSLSNQKVNSYLKEIADICEIKKNLTFHVARHTFATTVTLSNGVPIETVSKMLGHTKIATTQIYARVLEKKISDDMAKLRLKLG